MTDAVVLTINGPVASLTLARPARRNALDGAAWDQLAGHCQTLAARADVRVAVIEGEGEHFCAGADIHELRENIQDTAWMQASQKRVGAGLDAMAALPQVVIASIAGSCFGGGAAIALSADFRVAAETARFAITPAKLGLTYRLVDCKRVVDVVGSARARELLLLAREVTAVDAAAWGMVTQVVAADQRAAATQNLVAQVLALSAYSQTHIKANLTRIHQGQHGDDAATGQAFAAAFAGPDFLAAAEAFAKK